MTTNTTTSYITTVGQNLLTQSLGGTALKIVGAYFGSDVIANTSQSYLESLTNVISNGAAGYVYYATGDKVQYTYTSASTIQFRVVLGANIGGFSIGNWGLVDSNGNLITITALANSEVKTASSSSAAGDNRVFSINITMDDTIISSLDLSVISLGGAALPEVDTQAALPTVSTAAYPAFHILNYNSTSAPALASRTTTGWYYYLPYVTLKNLFVSQLTTSSSVTYSITDLGWGAYTFNSTASNLVIAKDSGGNTRYIADVAWLQQYYLTAATAATTYTSLTKFNTYVNQAVLTTSSPSFVGLTITKYVTCASFSSSDYSYVNTNISVGDYTNKVATTKFTQDSIVNGSGLNKSNNVPGFITLPGGWILQAGNMTTGANGFTSIVFPVAFPTRCISVICTEQNANGTWVAAQPTLYGVYGAGTTSASVYGMKWISSWSGVGGIDFGYIAIGF